MPKNSNMHKRTPKSDDGSSSGSESEEEIQMIDQKEYRKFLNTIFPSNYMKNKIQSDESDDTDESENASSSQSESETKKEFQTYSKRKKRIKIQNH